MEKQIREIMCEMAIVEEILKFCDSTEDILDFIDEANRQINRAIGGWKRKDWTPDTRADVVIANNQRREVAKRILDECEKHPEVSVSVHCYAEIIELENKLVELIDYTEEEALRDKEALRYADRINNTLHLLCVDSNRYANNMDIHE